MARIMHDDNTDIYRMRVTREWEDGSQFATAYGPHDSPQHARDWNTSRTYRDMPARLEKQKLELVEVCGGLMLGWVTIKVTYTNGGEGVEWGA